MSCLVAFLAVGIPTVLRLDAMAYYISDTLLTLIKQLDSASLEKIVFVVLVADKPVTNRTYILNDIVSHHNEAIKRGLIQVRQNEYMYITS